MVLVPRAGQLNTLVILNTKNLIYKVGYKMSDNSEKIYYIGLAFENENDAKIAQDALAKCENRTS